MRAISTLVTLLALTPAAVLGQTSTTLELVGITRAVAAAEQAVSARALEAEFDDHKGQLVYEIELVRDATLYKVLVDAKTGAVIKTTSPKVEGLWRRWFDATSLGAEAPSALAPILSALEQEKNGRVQEVGFEDDDGAAYYEIELATSAGVADVLVDARSGQRYTVGLKN